MTQAAYNCPFCGSLHLHIHHTQFSCYVHCDACGSSGPHQENMTTAITQWNRLSLKEHNIGPDISPPEITPTVIEKSSEEDSEESLFEHLLKISRVASQTI